MNEVESLASKYENRMVNPMTDETGTLFGIRDAFSNVNSAWGAWTVESLVRLGVKRFVVSPGSRSTPLTVAVAQHPLANAQVILDERSAAFYALGLARASDEPVVLICTSGSAGAHYYPALIEASESFVPLLVLTADRPDELQGCHAGQTIDQKALYGKFVRLSETAPLPEVEVNVLKKWGRLLLKSVQAATASRRGPVHLNCPFRDPLHPVKGQVDPKVACFDWTGCLIEKPRVQPLAKVNPGTIEFRTYGWIVAGPSQPKDRFAYASALKDLARALNWPIIADASNPIRHYIEASDKVVVCSGYDMWLRSEKVSTLVQPRQIIQLGELPTSKVLRLCLRRWQCEGWVVTEESEDFNSAKLPVEQIHAPVVSLLESWVGLAEKRGGEVDPRVAHIESIEQAVKEMIATAFLPSETFLEPEAGYVLFRRMGEASALYLASSMPVRDAEYFWPANNQRTPVFFNRGVNGIDGTLSTALGVAVGTGKPTVLYTGDLALLHDTNGWLIAKSLANQVSMTVVVINNDGGGIFNHLPISKVNAVFEDFFATPQGIDFRQLAKVYAVKYVKIASVDDLGRKLARLPKKGIRLLEVKTDRQLDAAWRKSLFAKIAQDLESASI